MILIPFRGKGIGKTKRPASKRSSRRKFPSPFGAKVSESPTRLETRELGEKRFHPLSGQRYRKVQQGLKPENLVKNVSIPFRGKGIGKSSGLSRKISRLEKVSIPFRGKGIGKTISVYLPRKKKVSIPFRGKGIGKWIGSFFSKRCCNVSIPFRGKGIGKQEKFLMC